MKGLLTALVALAVSVPAWGQTTAQSEATVRIQAARFTVRVTSGSLTFPNATLTGRDQVLTASATPTFEVIDARGDVRSGWRITLTASDLTGPEGARLPSGALRCRATGGVVQAVAGVPVDPAGGPRETDLAAPLTGGLTVLSARPGFGMGTYLYQPAPAAFELSVPASAPAGDYRGSLVANLVVGP
ncbi:MAG: WxL domain-containing protein [Candidatus Eremiobacterota bacterium]